MVSGGFLCTVAVVVDDVILVDDELSTISMFLSLVLWNFEIETDTVGRLLGRVGHSMFYLPSLWTRPIPLDILKWVVFFPNVDIIKFGWWLQKTDW